MRMMLLSKNLSALWVGKMNENDDAVNLTEWHKVTFRNDHFLGVSGCIDLPRHRWAWNDKKMIEEEQVVEIR